MWLLGHKRPAVGSTKKQCEGLTSLCYNHSVRWVPGKFLIAPQG